MRREKRKNNKMNSNTLIYISGGVLTVAIIAFIITFVAYSNRLNSNSSGILGTEYLSNAENNTLESTAEASSKVGKTIEESKNEISENTMKEQPENEYTDVDRNNKTTKETSNSSSKDTQSQDKKVEKEPEFVSPLEDTEVIKDFASDNLVYSETLKEWITHPGVDLKADKANVVKAAEEGTVKAIKNDPRYGLTIIIEHSKGYQTLYANLLTTEFVSEGEKVKKGQTIGTVGDTAVYEIADDSHLHFELVKHGVNQNPVDYIKF